MPDIVIHAVVSLGYAALAWHFWNTRWRRRAPASAGVQGWERAAILAVLALHGALLWRLFIHPQAPRFGFAFALSSMIWLAVLFYWIESFLVNLEGVQPVALGLAAVFSPLTAAFPGRAPPTMSIDFRIHLALAILAYGVLTVAMLHALLMALVEHLLHRLHRGQGALAAGPALRGPVASLPPLLTLERLLFRLIAVAFGLLTLTLVTGMTLSESLFSRPLRFNHETLFAIVSWVVFAILLAGRHFYGWRGRTATRWALAGFVMVVLASIGTRFVLEVILGRG